MTGRVAFRTGGPESAERLRAGRRSPTLFLTFCCFFRATARGRLKSADGSAEWSVECSPESGEGTSSIVLSYSPTVLSDSDSLSLSLVLLISTSGSAPAGSAGASELAAELKRSSTAEDSKILTPGTSRPWESRRRLGAVEGAEDASAAEAAAAAGGASS